MGHFKHALHFQQHFEITTVPKVQYQSIVSLPVDRFVNMIASQQCNTQETVIVMYRNVKMLIAIVASVIPLQECLCLNCPWTIVFKYAHHLEALWSRHLCST